MAGADAEFLMFQVVLRSNRRETIAINDIKVRVTKSGPPMTGTHALCLVGGASAEPVDILVTLETGREPLWDYVDEDDPESERKRSLPLVLSPQDLEFLTVTAHPSNGYFEWTLELLVSDGSGQQRITLDDGGQPFNVTSTENAEKREWDNSKWIVV